MLWMFWLVSLLWELSARGYPFLSYPLLDFDEKWRKTNLKFVGPVSPFHFCVTCISTVLPKKVLVFVR